MFILSCSNLINILLYSEIIWVILYSYTVIVGSINDDLILTSTSFFLLALAGLEFCIGFIITIFFKTFKKSFDLNQQEKQVSSNRYVWSYNK